MAKASTPHHVALVGGDSLLAREIRELLQADKPAPRIHLISATTDNSTVIKAEEEEVEVMTPLSAESLEGATVALLAGTAAASRRTLKLRSKDGPALIDLTASLEDQPAARLRAPSAEGAGAKTQAPLQVIAHPAAIALTMVLTRLAGIGKIKASVAHVFEPASERGQRGIEELRKQTVGVLTFQKLDITVFDTQLAFSLLANYGEEALEPLIDIEQRIERHTASLLSGWAAVPMPSIRTIQAPVFHGHSFSVWVEFESDVNAKTIAGALEASGIDVRLDEAPTNIQVTGQSGLSAGAIAVDRNNPRACWIWVVADNLRLAAENAVAVAKEWM